jgi:hypothetical protein
MWSGALCCSGGLGHATEYVMAGCTGWTRCLDTRIPVRIDPASEGNARITITAVEAVRHAFDGHE